MPLLFTSSQKLLLLCFSVFVFVLTPAFSAFGQSPGLERFDLFSGGYVNQKGNGWNQKQNVQLNWNETQQSLDVVIESAEFGFGWFQKIFPDNNYSAYAGVYGQYRVSGPKSGVNRITALLVLPQSGSPSEYYSANVGSGSDSQGAWVEFYLPFSAFVPARDATRSKVVPSMIQQGTALEISISSSEIKSHIEFRSFELLGPEEEKTLKRRIDRSRLGRLLKPEDALMDGVHPRLLLTGKRLERIRAKASEPGIHQDGYNRVIELADQAMKKINPDNPFQAIIDFDKISALNDHKNRARFEGQMNPLVIPLETLAAAAVITENEQYGRHAAKALVNMARTLDVSAPEINQGFYYTRTFYVRSLALGYDWLYKYLTPEERRDIKITLLGFVEDIYKRTWTDGWAQHPLNRVWNWNPGLVSCAGLGVLAMQGETTTAEDAMLIQFRRHLRDYLTFGVDFDGCCHEGPAYISYGIGAGVPFAECLRDRGYGDLFTETNWQLISPWLVSEILPNHPCWNNLSDCNYGQAPGCPVYSYACGRLAELAKTDPVRPQEKLDLTPRTTSGLDFVKHFSEQPGPRRLSYGALAELMGWAWNSGVNARTPSAFSDASALAFLLFYEDCPIASDPGQYLPDSLWFRGRGLVVSRQGGYGSDAFHLEIEAGPHACGHDQGDKGTFTLRAWGADFVIDSGYGNDGESLKSGSSFAHNVVLIDGRGQPVKWHNNSDGEITGYSSSPVFDWVRTDAVGAWNYSYQAFEKHPTGENVKRADRHFVFVRGREGAVPPYLITYDDFEKQDGLDHEFVWQLHTAPELQFDIQKKSWNIAQNCKGYKVLTTRLENCVGRAVFRLTAPADGKYSILGLTRAAGQDPGKSDSFGFTVDNGPRGCWDIVPSSSFAWSSLKDRDAAENLLFDLKKGERVELELFAREPEAQLAFLGLVPANAPCPELPGFPDSANPTDGLLSASAAIQNPQTPFLLADSVTETINACLSVFPVLTPQGVTETRLFETSQTGIHPRLTHTVKATNPNFLMVLVPRRNSAEPLPQVLAIDQSGTPGVRLIWPQGWTDTLVFRPGQNGKEPEFKRTRVEIPAQ